MTPSARMPKWGRAARSISSAAIGKSGLTLALTNRLGPGPTNGSPFTGVHGSRWFPFVSTDVWPLSGVDILPSLKRMNATDSGAPPGARISAGFSTVTR